MASVPNLIDNVQEEAALDSREEAVAAAKATLQTLGERVSREEAKDIASFLDEDHETWVIDWDHESTQDFPVGEFLERVAEREGVDEETARSHATAVVGVLESYAGNEMDRVRTQLPDGYEELF